MMAVPAPVTQRQHYPLHCFKESAKAAIVLLNCGHNMRGLEKPLFEYWKNFSLRVCADGGTNSLYDTVTERERYIPDYIVGDMDSARDEVLQYYTDQGSQVKRIPSQHNTDFDKAVDLLLELQKREPTKYKFSTIVAFNTLWGRFDQVLANINTLYNTKTGPHVSLSILTEDSFIILLQPGSHIIHTDTGLEEGHCGLVPVGETCQSCSTTGLKWNLDKHKLQMGGLISTNNLILNEAYYIRLFSEGPSVPAHNVVIISTLLVTIISRVLGRVTKSQGIMPLRDVIFSAARLATLSPKLKAPGME